MNKNNTKGRPKTTYDEKEVNEIIELKIKSIGNDLSKLTYNSVYKFNQYLVNKKLKNYKNEIYTMYGYAFWATEYKGVSNYGREQIDLYKIRQEPICAGEIFTVTTEDIEAIIDNNKDNIEHMKKILIKLFAKERYENAKNDKAFNELVVQLNKHKELLTQYKTVLYMLFYNSQYSNNSLLNIINLSQKGDIAIQNEILNIFNEDRILFDEIESMDKAFFKPSNSHNEKANNAILDMAAILKGRK